MFWKYVNGMLKYLKKVMNHRTSLNAFKTNLTKHEKLKSKETLMVNIKELMRMKS